MPDTPLTPERLQAQALDLAEPFFERSVLREQIRRHGGVFHGPRVEHLSMEEQAFWRFLNEVIATTAALATLGKAETPSPHPLDPAGAVTTPPAEAGGFSIKLRGNPPA